MKNIPKILLPALRLRRRHRAAAVGEALLRYRPVGWSAAKLLANGTVDHSFGGEAVIGSTQVGPGTVFRVASVSKVLVFAAAVRLSAAGVLPMDQDIAGVLAYDAGAPITLRQLLTHTAGLDDRLAYDAAIVRTPLPPLSLVLPRSHSGRVPGTAFRYSNLGAGVVGMLIERATGESFDAVIRRMFFAPLLIDASFYPQRIAAPGRMANCYRVPGRTLAYDAQAIAREPLASGADPEHHYNAPPGKLMIAAGDLVRVAGLLMREDPALFVRQAHIKSVRCDAGRGLGLAYAPPGVFADGARWGHQGVAYGALCELWMDPETGEAAALLTNGVTLNRIGPLYRAGQDGVAAMMR